VEQAALAAAAASEKQVSAQAGDACCRFTGRQTAPPAAAAASLPLIHVHKHLLLLPHHRRQPQ